MRSYVAIWNMLMVVLAVLKVISLRYGCVVKTAGVDESVWKFTGMLKCSIHETSCLRWHPCRESGRRGSVVVHTHETVRYQEMLYPTFSYIKSRCQASKCALITNSVRGGTSD